MSLSIGDLALDAIIQIAENQQYALSSLRGRNVVLYFYPKDSTPGCTIEAKAFNDLQDEFRKVDTVVIGVSKDDVKSHDNFKQKYELKFDLASDETTDICSKYGTLATKSMFGTKYLGVDRVTFFINRDGYIAQFWNNVSVFDHAREVLEFIQEYENEKHK